MKNSKLIQNKLNRRGLLRKGMAGLGLGAGAFGGQAFGTLTKYWTVADRNTAALPLSRDLLLNRLVWVGLAVAMGLSEALIGLTIVAIATSLPELVTALIAVRKGHHDLAIGNIVGSNLFNLLLVLGVTAAIKPVPRPEHGMWDLVAMTVITVLLWFMALTHKFKVTRLEGAVLLFLYVGYMTWSVVRELTQG